MVLNLGWFMAGDLARAGDDIRAVVRAAAGLPVEVIIETPLLDRKRKVDAAKLVQASVMSSGNRGLVPSARSSPGTSNEK